MPTALQRFEAAPIHTVDLDRTPIAYRVFGAGPPVIFVHGWPLSGVTYRGLVEHLRTDFTCYVLDLPGTGASPWDPEVDEIFRGFGQLIQRFVETLDLHRVALVGHDSGGTMARMAASGMPERVAALALTNTETPGHHVPLVRALQIAAAMPGAHLVFKLLLRSRAYLRSGFGFGGAFADLGLLDREFATTTIEPLRRDPSGPLAALRRADLAIVDQLAEIHAKITAPLLCVWGERDPFFPVTTAKAMVDAWPGIAHLEVIPGMKLFVHEEVPDRVASAMRPFLLRHLGPRVAPAIPA